MCKTLAMPWLVAALVGAGCGARSGPTPSDGAVRRGNGASTMTTSCGDTVRALAAGEILGAPGLVARCSLASAVAALPELGDAADSSGALGHGTSVRWRALRSGIAGELIRLWHDDGGVVAIEVERPAPRGGWAALRAALGEPPARFDYHDGVVVSARGLWVYPDRGLAVYTSLADTELERVMMFPPMPAAEFVARLARGQQPPHERPVE